MQTIRTEIHITDQALFDYVDGSSWSQYEWWQGANHFPDITGKATHAYLLTCYGKSEDDAFLTKVITIEDIAAAFNQLPAAQMALWNDDVDADIADQVMQVAVYGEVIYG